MARKLDIRGRRPEAREIDAKGDDPVWILGYGGNPLIGTASSDFLLAQDAATINGGGGDDFILGDIGPFGTAQTGNGSFATAYDFAFITHCFSTVENPLFADDSIPHATVYVLGENQQEYFQIVVGAGQTLTIDIDGAGGTVGSAVQTDTVVDLYAASELVNPLASNDDSTDALGGQGSVGGFDSFLTFTNFGAAATFYIRIREFGVDGNFETDDEFLLNLSLSGYPTGGTTHQHGDTINGEAGNDHLYGGAGNDILNGGSGFDVMVGGTGNDVLNGGSDFDVMVGGTGDDLFIVDDPSDFVEEAANEGNDRISARSSFQMSADASIETLAYFDELDQVALLLAGSSIANTITSNNGNDVLRGQGGNDILSGLGGADLLDGGIGADTMIGGAQSDTYFLDDMSDLIIEHDNLNGGQDIAYSSVSYTLGVGQSVEVLDVTDRSAASALNLTGNEFAQFIAGNNGNNILIGEGGADTLIGGGGNDIYRVEVAGDSVIEAGGGGVDSIYTLVSYALAAGSEVELLSAIDPNATDAFVLTGNEFANFVIGNNGSNTLIGGAGSDTLIGGAGNDFYRVEDSDDKVSEGLGGGLDSVYAVGNYTLAAGAEVELLSAIDPANTAAMTLVGNEFDNFVIGNNGVNTLIGGAGSDTLIGNGGNDFYRVEDSGDKITETAGGGTDSAYAVGSYTLQAGAEVELLSAIDPSNTVSMNLIGNEFANRLIGNNGANLLNGAGGSDILTGFGGADVFVFLDALGAGNIDLINDFVTVDDTVWLDHAVFTTLGTGALSAAAFATGAAATTAAHRIIYNNASGALFYDADGNGAGGAVQFATLSSGLSLTSGDFHVI